MCGWRRGARAGHAAVRAGSGLDQDAATLQRSQDAPDHRDGERAPPSRSGARPGCLCPSADSAPGPGARPSLGPGSSSNVDTGAAPTTDFLRGRGAGDRSAWPTGSTWSGRSRSDDRSAPPRGCGRSPGSSAAAWPPDSAPALPAVVRPAEASDSADTNSSRSRPERNDAACDS